MWTMIDSNQLVKVIGGAGTTDNIGGKVQAPGGAGGSFSASHSTDEPNGRLRCMKQIADQRPWWNPFDDPDKLVDRQIRACGPARRAK